MNRRELLKFLTALGVVGTPGISKSVFAQGLGIGVIATRFFPSPDYNRLTIELNGEPTFKTFVLENPNRIVIDLPTLSNTGIIESLDYKKITENNIISNIRTGQFDEKTTRLVLELNRALSVEPKIFTLKPIDMYNHRLVIDVYSNNQISNLYLDKELDDLIANLSNDSPPLEQPKLIAQNTPRISEQPVKVVEKPRIISGKKFIIAIDAGHGGEDPGAIGKGGLYEKTVTLQIAKKLERLINNTPGYAAVMTRNGDYFVPLGVRVAKARKANADLFISIHADASPNGAPHGSSVYALSENGATSVTAKWLANKENSADLIGGVPTFSKDKNLSKVLLELSTAAQISHSKILGQHILNDIAKYNKLHKRNVEQAGFAVLKAPDIPSILIETGFISNRDEERKLQNPQHQDKLVSSIFYGIDNYIRNYKNT